ncbi:MAG: Flavobacterium phage Fpv2 [Bacteroidota bacterium]|jgi:hypothetical protein
MAYLYRHIRLDKNEPFYIGISNVNDDYKRAYKKSCRNKHWTNIVKCTKYEVEILFDDLTEEEVKIKEKEFISLYGRVDLKTGSLVNLTDGGDGVLNMNTNSELRLKLSKAAIGKKMSESAKKKMGDNQKLPILQYDLDGNFIKEWDGIIDATKSVGKHSTNIMRCCNGKFKQAYGYIWKYKYPERMGRKPRKTEVDSLKQLVK